MNNRIKTRYYIICDRCGSETYAEEGTQSDISFINIISTTTVNYKGEAIEDIDQPDDLYICDDCWNDYIDFTDNKTIKGADYPKEM